MRNQESHLPSREQKTNNHTSNEAALILDGCQSAEDLLRRRELNDRLRTLGAGGIVVMTEGVAALGPSLVNKIFASVAAFDSFTPDNDPWGEHDCALLTVEGVKVLWKIDYFDRSRRFRSPDPANPKLTVRVLTVMRADEY